MVLLKCLWLAVVTVMALEFDLCLSWHISSVPHCLESCSHQVNCTVEEKTHCLEDASAENHDTPGPVSDLIATYGPSEDRQYKIITVTWKPPLHASFKQVDSFVVRFYSAGSRTSSACYVVKPHLSWKDTHKKLYDRGGVNFFLKCARLKADAGTNVEVVIHVSSNPHNSVHSAIQKVNLTVPMDSNMWNPRPHLDMKEDGLHLFLGNPFNGASSYLIKMKDPATRATIFQRQYNMKNLSVAGQIEFVIKESELKPDVNTENFTAFLEIDAQKEDNSYLAGVITNKYPISYAPVQVATVAGSGSRTVVYICVGVLLLVLLVGGALLCWRKRCRSILVLGRRKRLTQGNNLRDKPRILPIYCQESDEYVNAVKKHLYFLGCYLDILYIPDPPPWWWKCLPFPKDDVWIDREVKDRIILIYVSPGLQTIVQTVDSGLPLTLPMSCADMFCYKALASLKKQRASIPIPHFVTLGWESGAPEQDAFNAVKEFLFGGCQFLETDPHLQRPLALAKYENGAGWKVTNHDELLHRLYNLRDFPQAFPNGFHRWNDSLEAKEVERYLARFYNTPRPDLQASPQCQRNVANQKWESGKEGYSPPSLSPPEYVDSVCHETTDDEDGDEHGDTHGVPSYPLLPPRPGVGVSSCCTVYDSNCHGVNCHKSQSPIVFLPSHMEPGVKGIPCDKDNCMKHKDLDSPNCVPMTVKYVPKLQVHSMESLHSSPTQSPKSEPGSSTLERRFTGYLRHDVIPPTVNALVGVRTNILPPDLNLSGTISADSVQDQLHKINDNTRWDGFNGYHV